MTRRHHDRQHAAVIAVWLLMGLLIAAFWLWIAAMFVPTSLDLFREAGSLRGCVERGLTPADCTAFAQGDW